MGSKYSTPTTRSPSAAFGRLRIDSPTAQRHHRIIRQSPVPQQRSSFDNLRVVSPTEASPLILRKLESLPSGVAEAPPPYWIVVAICCAMCYAWYNIFIKLGSASIHPILGGVILQLVAAVFGILLISALIWKDGIEELYYDANGIKWAVCAGIAVGLAEILSFIVSGLGVPASRSIPIIIGGSVGFGTVMGSLVLKEFLTYRGWTGVVLIIVGVGLVGTDPIGAGAMD